ncbi:MAG: dTDP-4-dehydrorhamnose reductase [Actinobacteria bacterium]|nr:dTDP-4-dehydrorhamnose reductase [Actinomycetota bacterium]
MKVLVTGAAGQVGSELPKCLADLGVTDVASLGRGELDLADSSSVRDAVASLRPDAVINCAAYNAVDQAEAEPEAAEAVNAHGVAALAEACGAHGAHLIHISTDYVFAGDKGSAYDEGDPPAPLSAYGRSKLAGEEAALSATGPSTVARTAIVFGRLGRSLVETIVNRAQAGEPLRLVTDQRGSPTFAPDLARVLAQMAVERVEGLYHVVNAGDCSPFELAHLIFDIAGRDRLDGVEVEEITSEQLNRAAPRPPNSSLVSSRLAAAGFAPLRSLHDAVEERVREMVAEH